MFFARSSAYVPLLGESQPSASGGNTERSFNDCPGSPPNFNEKQPKRHTIPWTLIVVVACTLLNIALSLFPGMLSLDKVTPLSEALVTRQNIHLLRRPNQYIGFDDIQRPTPPVSRQLNTYPILLSLVDTASPDTVFEDDFATQMMHSGTITPDDRIVRVTPTFEEVKLYSSYNGNGKKMSTIIQFRAIDWGMEICELHIDLPTEDTGRNSRSGALVVYRVNTTVPLDSASLSHNTRPPRVAKVANIPLGGDSGVQWHRKFSCVTEEVLSFELGCLPQSEFGGDDGCFVEWVQIKDAIPAIHMVQHSTI